MIQKIIIIIIALLVSQMEKKKMLSNKMLYNVHIFMKVTQVLWIYKKGMCY